VGAKLRFHLSRIHGLKEEKITSGNKRFPNEELNNFQFPPNIITMSKSWGSDMQNV
jgi:hypothetical protein